MNRKGAIMMAVAMLLGPGVAPGVSVRSAAAADEPPQASTHVNAGTGLVRAVDTGTNTLVLETRSGTQRVHVAPAATRSETVPPTFSRCSTWSDFSRG
jgi:hypothetical protein